MPISPAVAVPVLYYCIVDLDLRSICSTGAVLCTVHACDRASGLNHESQVYSYDSWGSNTCIYSIRLHVYHLKLSLSGITDSSLDDRLRHHVYTSAIFYSFNIINPLRDPLSVLNLVYLF